MLLEGMKASADLYDQYIETYLHTEVPLDTAIDEKLLDDEEKTCVYKVSNIFSVILHQLVYIILCPLMAMKEIGVAGINALVRDFGNLKKNEVIPY